MSQEDELFDHLEQLVNELPQMQELGAQLERAEAAEKVLAAAGDRRSCETELAEADAGLAQERAAFEEATSAGDQDAIERHRLGIAFFSQQRGFRVGPAENARIAFQKALDASPFATLEEAQAAALPKDECAKLADDLAAYRADYDETFSACQRIEETGK